MAFDKSTMRPLRLSRNLNYLPYADLNMGKIIPKMSKENSFWMKKDTEKHHTYLECYIIRVFKAMSGFAVVSTIPELVAVV